MPEPLSVTYERVDDIPLLLEQLKRMGIQQRLDKHFPTHGNWQGISPLMGSQYLAGADPLDGRPSVELGPTLGRQTIVNLEDLYWAVSQSFRFK